MDEIIRFRTEHKEFAGSVLVAKGDRVFFDKSYGMANLEWSIPNTPTTKFRIGSLTKQFTAAAILLLEEQGKLKTDDLVKTHWPDAPAAWNKVTLFHLLTHTSGMPAPDNEAWRLSEGPTEKVVALFRDKPLDFEPGSQYAYSNAGYIVLGYLIERISGQSYDDFLKEKIFTPLGMKDTGVDSNAGIIAQRAAGYSPGPMGVTNAPYFSMASSIGSGALYSTTEDLNRWVQGLFGGKVLSAASLKKLMAPVKENYAMGLEVTKDKGRDVIRHGGSIAGFNTYLAWFPEEKLTIVALSNLEGDSTVGVVRRLSQLIHGETVVLPYEKREIQLPEDVMTKITGTYEFNPDANMVITMSNGKLSAALGTQETKQLMAESATRFFTPDIDVVLVVEQDSAGAATGIVLQQDGEESHAKRIAERVEVKLPPEVLQRYAGTYQIAPGADVIMTVEGERLMAKPPSDPKQELFAESENKFFFKTFNAQVEFTRNNSGQTTGLVFRNAGSESRATRR
jgi:CubicO group peptidase (beta-lactamase class C family)